MDPLRHVKPAVRQIRAYTLAAREAPVKINQNENPWDLPESVKRRVLERALVRPWSRYPDFDPRELTDALAAHAGWRPDGVLAGNGSNELIEALLLVTVGAGTRVVIPEPTFTLYALLTGILGGEAVRVPLTGDLRYDVDALVAARRENEAALTIVCTPNNPTGTRLSQAEIEKLCKAGDGLVVVDEAYHEFAGETAVPLLERHPNLVVLRTFSKAMALAGLRVGYLLSSPELVAEVNKARLPYNLNFFAQTAALAALEEQATLEGMVRTLVEEREALLAKLADVPGVRAWPSEANFFLLELQGASPKAVFEALYRRGVLVRDVSSYPMLSRCLRITVGTPEENETFLHALGAALGEAGVNLSADTGEGVMAERKARIERKTKETDITLTLNLDRPSPPPVRIKTGVGFFDHMLTALGKHSGLGLQVRCKGDLHVDAHHSVEDVGIALGQALKAALGDKKGVVRFGHAFCPLDEALTRAVVDLSGRPWLHMGVVFRAKKIGDMPTELFEDFFWALADHARLTLHLDLIRGRNSHHIAEATFKATARALAMAVALDPNQKGVPSTKGSL